MIKLFSEIIGATLITFQERLTVGKVEKIIIDPADGAFLGFGSNKQVVPVSEIRAVGAEFILIKDLASLTEPTEVVKISNALTSKTKIIGASVETESGQKLGKVAEAALDLVSMRLERLFVSPPISLQNLGKQLAISANKIIKIEKTRIIVSDEFIKAKSRALGSVVPCE